MQAEVDIAFPAVVALLFVSLDSRPSGFGLVLHGKDATMNTGTQLFAECGAFAVDIALDPANRFFSKHHE